MQHVGYTAHTLADLPHHPLSPPCWDRCSGSRTSIMQGCVRAAPTAHWSCSASRSGAHGRTPIGRHRHTCVCPSTHPCRSGAPCSHERPRKAVHRRCKNAGLAATETDRVSVCVVGCDRHGGGTHVRHVDATSQRRCGATRPFRPDEAPVSHAEPWNVPFWMCMHNGALTAAPLRASAWEWHCVGTDRVFWKRNGIFMCTRTRNNKVPQPSQQDCTPSPHQGRVPRPVGKRTRAAGGWNGDEDATPRIPPTSDKLGREGAGQRRILFAPAQPHVTPSSAADGPVPHTGPNSSESH